MSNPQSQLSTGENRTRVTLSTCESATSRESRTAVSPNVSRRKCSCLPLAAASRNPCVPSRRRVSFSDAVVDHDRHRTIMQNDLTCSRGHDNNCARSDHSEQETFYDIWQADDCVADRSDDGYESTPRIDNCSENRVSGYIFNKGRDSSENIDGTVARDGRARDVQGGGNGESDVRSTDRVAEDAAGKIKYEGGTMSSEDISNSSSYKDVDSIGRDECRMRGGCGGCCGTPHENVRRCSRDHACSCCYCYCGGGGLVEVNESCAPSEPIRCDGVKAAARTAITTAACASSVVPAQPRCCCRCVQGCRRAVCKKAAATRCGETVPACTTGARSCGGGGCCGGGCRGGCGQPGQICTPSSRVCSSPARGRPRSSRGRSPCARPRCPARSPCPPPSADCATTSGCSSGSCGSYHCCGGGAGYECGSSRCRSILSSGSCANDRTKCGADGACCRQKLPVSCECFGGGLDCRRCGRKVYQAEMQIASGAPYHNICFSCFCCRKPLESLTYQENCGEIYCKQCYVRNFGPQGYGYGAGAGVLQTPL